jgi:hypothetical protein
MPDESQPGEGGARDIKMHEGIRKDVPMTSKEEDRRRRIGELWLDEV